MLIFATIHYIHKRKTKNRDDYTQQELLPVGYDMFLLCLWLNFKMFSDEQKKKKNELIIKFLSYTTWYVLFTLLIQNIPSHRVFNPTLKYTSR